MNSIKSVQPTEREAFERWAQIRFCLNGDDGDYVFRDTRSAWAAWQARATLSTPAAPVPVALDEEQTQPFYDLAWKHGAKGQRSFAGDELHSLSFSLSDFEAFCAVLTPPAAVSADAWMWQHEETGAVGFIDPWQIENGWQQANPRLKLIRPLVFAAMAGQPAGEKS